MSCFEKEFFRENNYLPMFANATTTIENHNSTTESRLSNCTTSIQNLLLIKVFWKKKINSHRKNGPDHLLFLIFSSHAIIILIRMSKLSKIISIEIIRNSGCFECEFLIILYNLTNKRYSIRYNYKRQIAISSLFFWTDYTLC